MLQMQTAAAAAQATQDQQTQNAITQAQQKWQEQSNNQLQERDNKIRQLTANLANLNAQAQQGHAQAAGEVGEVAVKIFFVKHSHKTMCSLCLLDTMALTLFFAFTKEEWKLARLSLR